MSRWFRLYDDLVDDPKIQRLSGETVKALLNLWCLASQNDGLLPAVDDIAFKLRMKPAKVQDLLSVLGECGLIDSSETGLMPHNWDKRQFKSDVSTERVKRFRKQERNVSVTPPETEQIQSRKDAAPAALSVVPDPPPMTAAELEKSYFDRGKLVLGKNAGGILKNLLKAKENSVALARAAIEQASTKSNPREYVSRIVNGQKQGETAWLGGVEGIL